MANEVQLYGYIDLKIPVKDTSTSRYIQYKLPVNKIPLVDIENYAMQALMAGANDKANIEFVYDRYWDGTTHKDMVNGLRVSVQDGAYSGMMLATAPEPVQPRHTGAGIALLSTLGGVGAALVAEVLRLLF
jgi:hypothetical protein